VPRESKILLTAGFLLLFFTIAWSVRDPLPSVTSPVAPFVGRGEPAGSLPLVAIVFTPADCSGLIEQLRFWNGPYMAREARVSGQVRLEGEDLTPLWKVVRGAGLSFPVRRASDATVAVQRSLGYPYASVVAVFDARNRVRMALPLSELANPARRAEVMRVVRSLRETETPPQPS